MSNLYAFLLGATVFILFFLPYLRRRLVQQSKTVMKSNINSWMQMSRTERLSLEQKEMDLSLKRREALLDQIRSEYKAIRRESPKVKGDK